MLTPSSKQVDIFSDDKRQQHFAELCNALYERELASLSQQKFNNISLLQRKIAGLRHHIKRAAYSLLQYDSPLEVDLHNASWQAKQAAKCMAGKADADKTEQWYFDNVKIGRCIPIHVDTLGAEHIELDSVDRIDLENAKLHANKFGWFAFNGTFLEDSPRQIEVLNVKLLKPSKAILTAACCGHHWNHKGRSQQRALSLRELLLSLSIDWKTFK
ncbi:hypothetical protein [Paraglaciecola marina]|uniref:hypothetical protein n=1 Tax=Paraglaciecola marina TaxID=2500157 RepID=UPI00105BDF38|nr:hypothetical protein [Paraglaciecola marina]